MKVHATPFSAEVKELVELHPIHMYRDNFPFNFTIEYLEEQ